MPQPECWPRCAQAPVYSLPSAVLVRHALRHDSTTGALHRGPWSYQYASEGEITRLSPNFVFNRGDFIEGRKWAMRLARSRHALAAFGAETALQGHPLSPAGSLRERSARGLHMEHRTLVAPARPVACAFVLALATTALVVPSVLAQTPPAQKGPAPAAPK